MPNARSRLADVEGCPFGRLDTKEEVQYAIDDFREAANGILDLFLGEMRADATQTELAKTTLEGALLDIIADATARQLREIEEGE
jgi:hypothetical protein